MILDEILEEKRREVAERAASRPLEVLQSRAEEVAARRRVGSTPVPSLRDALSGAPGFGLIAEVKRTSPSAGLMREISDPAALAGTYEDAGADVISVLTDAKFFRGSLDDLRRVRRRVSVPVLRKDFIIDPYQVWESAWAGAGAILLIVSALDSDQLARLHALARRLQLECLVEVHTRSELERALDLDSVTLIGINNRDLHTFETRIETTLELAPLARGGHALLVSESGIHSASDVAKACEAGARGILVGEALVRSGRPDRKIAELRGALGGGDNLRMVDDGPAQGALKDTGRLEAG